MRCLLWNYLNFFLFKISCGIGFDKLVMCEAIAFTLLHCHHFNLSFFLFWYIMALVLLELSEYINDSNLSSDLVNQSLVSSLKA